MSPALVEKLRQSKFALEEATSDNIIELCRRYLALLTEARDELYQLPDKLELNLGVRSVAEGPAFGSTRKAIRAAIEQTTQERNRVTALLLSFTALSGYQAVLIFNRQKYQGHDDWQLSSGGIRFSDSAGEQRMTIQAAVEMASLLRRVEHIAGIKPVTDQGSLLN